MDTSAAETQQQPQTTTAQSNGFAPQNPATKGQQQPAINSFFAPAAVAAAPVADAPAASTPAKPQSAASAKIAARLAAAVAKNTATKSSAPAPSTPPKTTATLATPTPTPPIQTTPLTNTQQAVSIPTALPPATQQPTLSLPFSVAPSAADQALLNKILVPKGGSAEFDINYDELDLWLDEIETEQAAEAKRVGVTL